MTTKNNVAAQAGDEPMRAALTKVKQFLGDMHAMPVDWTIRESELLYVTVCAALKAQPAPTEAAQGEDSARLDAAQDVLAERRRQIEVEGWTPARDDRYNDCQLAAAAATYALCTKPDELKVCGITAWPWSAGWWRPTSYRRNLVKAGALIIAEIERIDRARASAETGGVKP